MRRKWLLGRADPPPAAGPTTTALVPANPADVLPMFPWEGPPAPREFKAQLRDSPYNPLNVGDALVVRANDMLRPPMLPRLNTRSRASAFRNAAAHDTIALAATAGAIAIAEAVGLPLSLELVSLGVVAAVAADQADTIYEKRIQEALTPPEAKIYEDHDDIPRTIALSYAFGVHGGEAK